MAEKFNEITGENVTGSGMEQRLRRASRKLVDDDKQVFLYQFRFNILTLQSTDSPKPKPRAKAVKRKSSKKGDDDSDSNPEEPPSKAVKTSGSDEE
jgi:hypothetical protein